MPFKKFLPYILIALILAAAAFFIFHRTDDPKSAEQKSDSVNLKSEIINHNCRRHFQFMIFLLQNLFIKKII
jgi:hypothetical protein